MLLAINGDFGTKFILLPLCVPFWVCIYGSNLGPLSLYFVSLFIRCLFNGAC
jgi:hypothetical protein